MKHKEKKSLKKIFSSRLFLLVVFALVILLILASGKSFLKRYQVNREIKKLEQEVAQMKLDAMSEQENINVSAVRIQIDATDAYRELKKKRAMIKSAEELIRVAKKMSDRESGF